MTLVDMIWLLYGEHVKYFVQTFLAYLEVLAWPLLILGLVWAFRKQVRETLTAFQERVRFMTGASAGSFNFTFAQPSAQDLAETELMPPGPPVATSSDQNRGSAKAGLVQRLLNDALEASKQGDHQEAISSFRQVNVLVPNQIQVIHNLAVELIRLGKKNGMTEPLMEAETLCKSALPLSNTFPYGTFYNLARAQAEANNIQGLRETLGYMLRIDLPENLARALAEEDMDIRKSDEIEELAEYKQLVQYCRVRFPTEP